MGEPTNLKAMSIDELWELHQNVCDVLAAKMNAEKQKLERRLVTLQPTPNQRIPSQRTPNQRKARRPYPPVLPKFANPDVPGEVWSGRGKKPRWVTKKLSAGWPLQHLAIVTDQGDSA